MIHKYRPQSSVVQTPKPVLPVKTIFFKLATKITEYFRRGRVHIKQCWGKWVFPPLTLCNNVTSITKAMKPEKQESGTNFTDTLDFFSACGLIFWKISEPWELNSAGGVYLLLIISTNEVIETELSVTCLMKSWPISSPTAVTDECRWMLSTCPEYIMRHSSLSARQSRS